MPNLAQATLMFRSYQPPPVISPDCARVQSDFNLMLSRGWCSHQIRSLARTCGPDLFSHFASFDQVPTRQVDHRACNSASNCVAFNVDMKSYKPRHVNPECTCASATVSNEQLLTMIDRHEIPLVSIETPNSPTNDQPTLSLQKRTTRSSYTAISHVWIDGLGNPEANALPSCQLRQLAGRLLNTTGSSNVRHLGTFGKTLCDANSIPAVFVLARHFVCTYPPRTCETEQHRNDGVYLCRCGQRACVRCRADRYHLVLIRSSFVPYIVLRLDVPELDNAGGVASQTLPFPIC